MVVFETHDDNKIVWVVGWRPKHPHAFGAPLHNPHLCTPWARKGVVGYLGWGCLKCTMLKRIAWVLGWRTNNP